MQTVELKAQFRTKTGKHVARQGRRLGKIPAIVYGHQMDPVSILVDLRELKRALHTKAGENVVVDLKVEGVEMKESTCIIKEIQHNPVTDEIAHVDFTVISLTEKIVVQIPVVAVGAEEAAGVKEGGSLDVVHHEIEIECLPTQIPEHVKVDVKAMKINDVVYAKDLKLPEGVICKFEPEEVIIAVHPPAKVEEEAAAVPAEGEAAAAMPEVIEKGKKEDKAAAEGAAPAESKEAKR